MTSAILSWLARRRFPLLATIIMTAIGMAGTIWGPLYYGKTAWGLPDDLWGTLIAAQRLIHLNLAGLYTPPTQLVSLPGTAIILIPVVAVMDLAGIAVQAPGIAMGHQPASWLIAGPYQVFISAVVLFAADALAERLGVTWPKRFVLAAAGATALWGVTIAVGSSRRRRGDGPAALRHLGPGRLETEPGRLAGRSGGGGTAARHARVARPARRRRARSAGPASSPGRPPPAWYCWPSRPRPTGRPPCTRSPASPTRRRSTIPPRGSTWPPTWPAARSPRGPPGSWPSRRPADAAALAWRPRAAGGPAPERPRRGARRCSRTCCGGPRSRWRSVPRSSR